MNNPNSNPGVTASAATSVGHKNFVTATITAIHDRFSTEGQLPPLDKNERIDGKVCLVTGANSGLGKAVAIQLAQRGGRVIMACRGGHPEAGEDVKKASGNPQVEMIRVDLSDLDSVNDLCDQLRDRGIVLDIAVMNAGLMPLNARKSPQGFELMFAVHFLGNRLMLERWLKDGVIRPRPDNPPRVIFVSSETHKSAEPIDFDHLGEFVDYGLKDGMKHYSMTKLLLCTYVNELSRRLNPDDQVNVAIHSLCPGPVASNMARESPAFLKPILTPIMKLFFLAPEQAAKPVLYLACSPDMGRRTGVYLHMMREKATSSEAANPEKGKRLWDKSDALLRPYRRESGGLAH